MLSSFALLFRSEHNICSRALDLWAGAGAVPRAPGAGGSKRSLCQVHSTLQTPRFRLEDDRETGWGRDSERDKKWGQWKKPLAFSLLTSQPGRFGNLEKNCKPRSWRNRVNDQWDPGEMPSDRTEGGKGHRLPPRAWLWEDLTGNRQRWQGREWHWSCKRLPKCLGSRF